MLTGEKVVSGSTNYELILNISKGKLKHLPDLLPTISNNIESIYTHMIAKNKQHRYDNAELLEKDIYNTLQDMK